MSISRDLILFAVVLLGAAAAGVWVLESNQNPPASVEQQAQTNSTAEIERMPYAENATTSVSVDHDVVIQQQFEDFINDFLDQLTQDIRAYKIKRQIVRDLIQPINVRNEEYLNENNEMLRDLSKEMISDMDKIILSFEEADKKIHTLVSTSITDNKGIILNEWESIKKDQLGAYVSYFVLEKELLTAYEDMFNFYIGLGSELKVDAANNQIEFSNAKNRKIYEAILGRIDNVKEESAHELKEFTQEQRKEDQTDGGLVKAKNAAQN